MDTKGGRYIITINGTRYAGRGKAGIKPARAVPTADANRDGSGYRVVAAKLAEISLTFDRGNGFPWDETMLLSDVDVSFQEEDVGVAHYLTAASWSGDPEIDSDSGEVSGMTLRSDQYRRVAA